MDWYQAYGHKLASELPFPELRSTSRGEAKWNFCVGSPATPPGLPNTPLLGSQLLYQDQHARLFQMPEGWRIVVDDTGVYDLTEQGSRITWSAFPDATLDFARAHFLGRVLATSMHFNGALVLHGSAVSYRSGAVLFLAPKHTGKSTLALALTLAGARLISDDTITVALSADGRPEVWPGIHSLRLQPDAAAQFASQSGPDQREDGKHLVTDLPGERLEQSTCPLAAVYLLVAAESLASGGAVIRRKLAPPLAAAAIVAQGKISEMLGPSQAPVLLQRAARVASLAPVYQLAVQRDLGRLDEVAGQLAEWHDSGTAA